MSETTTTTRRKTTVNIAMPGRFKVVVYNDSVTPMEFVVLLLTTIFKHGEQAATDLMFGIHTDGSAIVGVYPYEIAEQKAIDATKLSRSENYPLVIKVETE